jgi:hypothetical protein
MLVMGLQASRRAGSGPGPVLRRLVVIVMIISNGYADVAWRSPEVTASCLPTTVVDTECSMKSPDIIELPWCSWRLYPGNAAILTAGATVSAQGCQALSRAGETLALPGKIRQALLSRYLEVELPVAL